MIENFSVAFAACPQPVQDVWETINAFLVEATGKPNRAQVSQIAGHALGERSELPLTLDSARVSQVIGDRNLQGFSVEVELPRSRISFTLRNVGEVSPYVLEARMVNGSAPLKNWSILIEGLAVQWPLIGCWLWKDAYQKWQWAKHVRFYEKSFGCMPQDLITYFKTSDDGIGPKQELVDISLNPGRPRYLTGPVYFLPTAEMWLGSHFWKYAKCSKEEALAADFFIEGRDTSHFLYLKSWREPFTRPDGEQGRQQQRLWKLFFNEDCEWPPGSGGVCDEPMYGPPELMPKSK